MSKKSEAIVTFADLYGLTLLESYSASMSKARKANFFDNTKATCSRCTLCHKLKEPNEFWTTKVCRVCYRRTNK